MFVEINHLKILYKSNWVSIPDRSFTFSKNIEWIGESDLIQIFFEAIFGLNQNYKGDIKWNGKRISEMSFHENIELRKNCSLVFDWGGLISNQTLLDNILFPASFHGLEIEKNKKNVEAFFGLLDYSHYLGERPYLVPVNIRKIASLLRACSLGAKVLFIENISQGLEAKDIKPLEFFLIQQDTCLHYYDGLAKFSGLNADKIEVIDESQWKCVS